MVQFSAWKSDLAQTVRNLTSVSVDLMKWRFDLWNTEMVWQKIGLFPSLLFFRVFSALGVFRKSWRKARYNGIRSEKEETYLEMLVEVCNSDDLCYPDQFWKIPVISVICKLQTIKAPPILHEQTSTISDLHIQNTETECYKTVKWSNHRSQWN